MKAVARMVPNPKNVPSLQGAGSARRREGRRGLSGPARKNGSRAFSHGAGSTNSSIYCAPAAPRTAPPRPAPTPFRNAGAGHGGEVGARTARLLRSPDDGVDRRARRGDVEEHGDEGAQEGDPQQDEHRADVEAQVVVLGAAAVAVAAAVQVAGVRVAARLALGCSCRRSRPVCGEAAREGGAAIGDAGECVRSKGARRVAQGRPSSGRRAGPARPPARPLAHRQPPPQQRGHGQRGCPLSPQAREQALQQAGEGARRRVLIVCGLACDGRAAAPVRRVGPSALTLEPHQFS